jgi:chromosome segregation ATPase
VLCRSQFEEEQLKVTRARLDTLGNTAEDEQRKAEELEEEKCVIQAEITGAQAGIARLRETLQDDLCKPTQRKYETAISGILGRNIDAAIDVDQAKRRTRGLQRFLIRL